MRKYAVPTIIGAIALIALLLVPLMMTALMAQPLPPGGPPGASTPVPQPTTPPTTGGGGTTGGGTTTTTGTAVPNSGTDGRINFSDLSAPIAVFCTAGNGISVYQIDLNTSTGEELFQASNGLLAAAISQAKTSGRNVTIGSSGSTALYALTSGEFQVNGVDPRPGKGAYTFTFPSTACGPLVATAEGLQVLVSGGVTTGATTVDPLATTASAAFSGNVYLVQTGDTLYAIARRFGVTVADILSLNTIPDPRRISVGQQIRIPTSTYTPSTNVVTTTVAIPNVTVASSGNVHVVQAGENLFRIALSYGVSLDDMARLNGIADIRLIYPGQQLQIPGRSGSSTSTSTSTTSSSSSTSTTSPTATPSSSSNSSSSTSSGEDNSSPSDSDTSLTLTCDPRATCSTITTCAEAYFQFTECGLDRLDSNGDGVPCKDLCPGDKDS